MQLEMLQTLYDQRIDGENINQTWSRLKADGYFIESTNQELTYNDELVIPRFKVVQHSCQIEGATPGFFRNSVTEEEVQTLEDVVFLHRQYTRSFFAENDFSGHKRCWTWNGYTPATEDIIAKTNQNPISSECAKRDENGKLVFVCPLSQWRNQLNEIDPKGTKPPLCKASTTCFGLDLRTQMPFTIIFHGSALPIIKSFLRVVNYKCEEARLQGKDLQLYHFKTTISLKEQTTSRGRFFIPKFEKKEIVSSDELMCIKKAYDHFKTRFLEME